MRRYIAPVYDYALMTEPLSTGAAGVDRLEAAPGPRRHGEPVPLLPPDRATTGSSGAATTPSTATAGPCGPDLDDDLPDLRHALAALLHDLSRSSKACASRIAGAERSTPAAASRSSSARRTAGGSPTRSGTRASASSRPASERASASTCSTAARPTSTRLRYVRSKPVPFPPEPLRSGVIQLTRNRLGAADRKAGPPRPLAAHARPAGPRLRQLSRRIYLRR